jgi:hypothetical protein
MNYNVLQKIEKLLVEADYPMTDEQKTAAAEMYGDLKKSAAKEASKAVQKSKELEELIKNHVSTQPETPPDDLIHTLTNSAD